MRRHTRLLHAFSRQMVDARVVDSANRLGAEVFMTAVPVLFVVAAFSPQSIREQLIDSVRAVLGLRGASLEELTQVFDSSDEDLRNAYGFLGISPERRNRVRLPRRPGARPPPDGSAHPAGGTPT